MRRHLPFARLVLLAAGAMLILACPASRVVREKPRVFLTFGKDHAKWKMITKRKVISVHHGGTEKAIYVNKIGYKVSMGQLPGPHPVGSVYVMVLFKNGVRQDLALVMRREERGYDPHNGDWRYFEVRMEDWSIIRGGRLPDCAECHRKSAMRDYVPVWGKDGL